MPRAKIFICLLCVIALVLSACGGDDSDEGEVDMPPRPVGEVRVSGRLSGVESWAYQLQNIDLGGLAASDYDLIVIDYADNGGNPFPRGEIARLKESGKIVLSYFSIGEAETYRPYWNPAWVIDTGDECFAELSGAAPAWLDPANPEWCGNYAVRFWDEEWQAIILDYLDAILATGFDGVYLDKVDIFYYWIGEEDLGATSVNEDAAVQMLEFVGRIAGHGRAADPGFIVMPQNAPELIEYLDGGQIAEYFSIIDGIAVEDTFFFPRGGAEAGDNAPYNPQEYVLDLLAVYQEAGLPVFAVDYVTQAGKVERFIEEARAQGFIPYAATRELDRLTTPSE